MNNSNNVIIDYHLYAQIEDITNYCPHCDTSIRPILLQTVKTKRLRNVERFDTSVMLRCPKCSNVYFASFQTDENSYNDIRSYYNLNIFPTPQKKLHFSDKILSMSDRFVKTFNQSEIAENMNLTEICGSGYRLAFEILIIDFAASENNELADKIRESANVTRIIEKHLPDSPYLKELKEMSERAWWLGCDYSHYLRKYTDQDISTLKKCIALTVRNIESYYAHNELLMELPTRL